MKHPSAYLDWYIHVPHVKHDFRSSGLINFRYELDLGDADLSVNYAHGNPDATRALASWYDVRDENVFISSEGATGQNARIIRYLAEKTHKTEAVIEHPTYEPILRQVQEHFPTVKKLERKPQDDYRLNADALKKIVSDKTALLVVTNPHAPSGAASDRNELREIMEVADEFGFFVVCDEIYAEFDRTNMPTAFSICPERGIVTTSFTKAYGLGGLKLGTALASKQLVDELYADVLNTVGNTPNVVQLMATDLLTKGRQALKRHQQKWLPLRRETEEWLRQNGFDFFPNVMGVTYWVKTPIEDTFKWTNEHAIPRHAVAPVPGTFFLFREGYDFEKSCMIRLSLGAIDPDEPEALPQALGALDKAIKTGAQK